MTSNELYLTEADVHGDARANWKRQAPLTAAELRAYVVYHALFSGPLVVGDSQILNNPALRAGVGESTAAAEETFRADLLELVESGVLQVAVRSSADSLVDVARQHQEDKVDTTDDKDYIDAVSEAASRNPRKYSFKDVGASFTRLVLDYVRGAPDDQVAPENRKRLEVFIDTQTLGDVPLKFNDLKRWAQRAHDDRVLSKRELTTLLRQVARIYRYGVPTALRLGTDFPSNRGPAAKRLMLEEDESRNVAVAHVRRYVVGQDFSRQIPAGAVNDILSESAAKAYFAAAEDATVNRDLNAFAKALEDYESLINSIRIDRHLEVEAASQKERTRIEIVATALGLTIAGFALKDLAPMLLYGDPPVVLEVLRTGTDLLRRPAAEAEYADARTRAAVKLVTETPVFVERPRTRA